MVIGVPGWIGGSVAAYVASEAFGGLGKGGLITIIVISIIAIVAFVWIFRETGKRD
jgi:cation transporter-like permease